MKYSYKVFTIKSWELRLGNIPIDEPLSLFPAFSLGNLDRAHFSAFEALKKLKINLPPPVNKCERDFKKVRKDAFVKNKDLGGR